MGFLLYISYHGAFIYSYGILLYGCIPSDVIKKKKEYNIYGRIVLNFDDKHTIAHMGQSVQPEDTFIKK